MAIAAYNAGPARVNQWIGQFGDPRAKNADVIDWIESIPIGETRNYVQRVLENLQVYRLTLGDRAKVFELVADQRRADLIAHPTTFRPYRWAPTE